MPICMSINTTISIEISRQPVARRINRNAVRSNPFGEPKFTQDTIGTNTLGHKIRLQPAQQINRFLSGKPQARTMRNGPATAPGTVVPCST